MDALVGLGSNLGDRAARLRGAVDELATVPGIERRGLSSLYETAPVGGPAQGWYLNAVARFETDLEPRALLRICLDLEIRAGRVRTIPNAARTLDLDVLAMGGEVLDGPELTLPHPRMHRRPFVLVPLLEVAPDWQHPVLQRSAGELLDDLGIDFDAADVRPYRP